MDLQTETRAGVKINANPPPVLSRPLQVCFHPIRVVLDVHGRSARAGTGREC